jgi:hypothetical protein
MEYILPRHFPAGIPLGMAGLNKKETMNQSKSRKILILKNKFFWILSLNKQINFNPPP